MTHRNFSLAQIDYMAARATFDIAREEYRAHGLLVDHECERLGIVTPYGILPEGHHMLVEAQRLLDRENEASAAMHAAAGRLFDWASETALAKKGSPKQEVQVREMVAKVKKMAFVEKPFIELVDISLRLAA